MSADSEDGYLLAFLSGRCDLRSDETIVHPSNW